MKLYGRSFDIRTYADAEKYLAGRDKAKVVNNTFLVRLCADTIAVRFFKTDVVVYTDNEHVTLNTGGWKTVTTKERLNLFSQYGVYVRRGIWYVSRYLGNGVHEEIGKFVDGMTLPVYTKGKGVMV